MAFDGIVIRNITKDLKDTLSGARIAKIAQPEKDALLLQLKPLNAPSTRLYISSSPSLPLIYFVKENKKSPLNAPNFCMLLRKHIAGGRIVDISQPDLERVIRIKIEHLNELGDLCTKNLIIEIMGKHSNIIFTDESDKIIDSIKHISSQVSSVREVLPGRNYFIPAQGEKGSIFNLDYNDFKLRIINKPLTVCKAIYMGYTGISPLIASECAYRANIDANAPTASLSDIETEHLYKQFTLLCEDIISCDFSPQIVYDENKPVEFSSINLTQYEDYNISKFDSISDVLENYYSEKDIYTRMRQKSSDLRKITTTLLERNVKKLTLQMHQLKDTEKRDKYRLYGELINTYGYGLKEDAKSLSAIDFNTGEEVTIPLKEDLTPSQNAQRYFDKYSKMKRTNEALTKLTKETQDEISHLESILSSLDIATSNEDLSMIKEELVDCGYIKKHGSKNAKTPKSKPLHYVTSEGYDLYVGKNNYQNDYLTFKFASAKDWFFHAKKIPGSHVILKSSNAPLSDKAFEDAAALAAYYSKGRESSKIDIDYVQKKEVKKPGGAKPGFVVYYTNYSMTVAPDISSLTLVKE